MQTKPPMRAPISFLALTLLLGTVGGVAIGRQSNPPAQKLARPHSKMLNGYKKWTRVNSKPHQVLSTLSARCFITPQEFAEMKADPHRYKWVTVYVNKPAENAMLKQKRPVFPRGSIIVKEKLDRPDSKAPELMTVMRKRTAGYDPANGDWEYLVFNGDGNRVIAQGRLPNCQLCHNRWRTQSGYVSPREYLSAKLQADLK